MLREITDGLWEYEAKLRFMGIPMLARMTVIQLADGGLFVHSPSRLTPELQAALGELGPVRAVVAPNRFHHLSIAAWREAYPDACVAISPGLPAKRKDLADLPLLSDDAPAIWSSDLDQHVVQGMPAFEEVVFHHRASRTLIVTDLAFNVREEPNWFARTFWRLANGYGKFGPTRLERWLTRDRAQLRQSLETILAWDFDRVVVGHGEVLDNGGKDALRDGYVWALPAARPHGA